MTDLESKDQMFYILKLIGVDNFNELMSQKITAIRENKTPIKVILPLPDIQVLGLPVEFAKVLKPQLISKNSEYEHWANYVVDKKTGE